MPVDHLCTHWSDPVGAVVLKAPAGWAGRNAREGHGCQRMADKSAALAGTAMAKITKRIAILFIYLTSSVTVGDEPTV